MLAVAELNHQDLADLIHNHFYLLAKDDLAIINTMDTAEVEMFDIFHEAMMLNTKS